MWALGIRVASTVVGYALFYAQAASGFVQRYFNK